MIRDNFAIFSTNCAIACGTRAYCCEDFCVHVARRKKNKMASKITCSSETDEFHLRFEDFGRSAYRLLFVFVVVFSLTSTFHRMRLLASRLWDVIFNKLQPFSMLTCKVTIFRHAI